MTKPRKSSPEDQATAARVAAETAEKRAAIAAGHEPRRPGVRSSAATQSDPDPLASVD